MCTERSQDGKYLLVLSAEESGTCCTTILDERDAAIVERRLAQWDRVEGPRVGDFVIFADGVERRISHAYLASEGWPESTFQTSDITGGGWAHGRWYLGEGYCQFGGGLHPAVPGDTFTDTGETREGSAWIFHHDQKCADNSVDFHAPFRVFTCSLAANR